MLNLTFSVSFNFSFAINFHSDRVELKFSKCMINQVVINSMLWTVKNILYWHWLKQYHLSQRGTKNNCYF